MRYVFVVWLLHLTLPAAAQVSDSCVVSSDSLSNNRASARFFLCQWKYTGQNVSGISIIGSTDYYGQNTSVYRINGLVLSVGGGSRMLNGVGLGVFGSYHTVNGLLIHPFFTSAKHLSGVVGPALFVDLDTLNGLAPFSLFAFHHRLIGVSCASFWQGGSSVWGLTISGIGSRTDYSFNGVGINGIVGIYDCSFNGVSFSGIGNNFSGDAAGFSLSGIYSRASQGFNGVSISLLRNKSQGRFNGLQAATFCRTQTLRGVQAGLINRSYRISGVQFGLINIVHSNPKGRRVLPLVNWNLSAMKDTIVSVQKDGLTRYCVYSDDGFLKQEYFLKNGLRQGVEKYYLTDGKVEKEISWNNGQKLGWEFDHLDQDLTALFWENDSLLIRRHEILLPLMDEQLCGNWFLEEHANGSRTIFLIRDIQQDTINRVVDSMREGVHFLGKAGYATVWGNFKAGKISGIYVQSPSGKKHHATITETLPLNFEVKIIIREKDLFAYDEYSSDAISAVLYPYFPENCNISISVYNPANKLLFKGCVIKEEKKFTQRDTSCPYFRTEEHNNKQMIYYWNDDSVTSVYKNGRLAFRQLLSPGKTTTRDNGSVVTVTKSATVYYKNKQCASYETKDTLLLYTKRGKPVLSRFGDTITLFNKAGNELLFYNPDYRRYTNNRGLVIAERFGDSLVKYDNAGKQTHFSLIKQDTILTYTVGDSIEFLSDELIVAQEIFFIPEQDGVVGEMETFFLLWKNKELEDWCGTRSIRFYRINNSISPYFSRPEVYFEKHK